MSIIQDSRLDSVEPIIEVVGHTKNGDWLLRDRNDRLFSLRKELIDEYLLAQMLPPVPFTAIAPAPEPDVTIAPVVEAPPKGLIRRRKKKAG